MEQVTRWLVLGLIVVTVRTASADSKEEEAKVHFANASALYDRNDLRGALAEFQRAYDLFASYKIQFNIGQVAMELQDYAAAFQAYTRYLKEGGPDIAPTRVATVQHELDRITTRIGRVTIRAADGAEVIIDGARVGYTPLSEPVVVGVGHHEVTVRGDSVEPTTRSIDVAGQQTVTVAVTAAPEHTVVAPVRASSSPPSPPSNTSTYVAWSLAGAFALTGGIAGGIAISDSHTLTTLRNTYPVTLPQLQHERSSIVTASAIADSAGAAAIIAGSIGLYLILTHRHERSERHVQLTISPAGAFAVGTF
jgi:hypothetical protein